MSIKEYFEKKTKYSGVVLSVWIVAYWVVCSFILYFILSYLFGRTATAFHISSVISTIITLKRAERIEPQKQMFRLAKIKMSEIKSIAICLGIMIASVIVLTYALSPSIGTETYEKVKHSGIVAMIFAVILAPLIEEIVFRGILGSFFSSKEDKLFIITSATLFGALHIQITGNAGVDLLSFFGPFLCGLLLAFYYRKENNLSVPIIVHSLFNLIALAF